MASSPSSRVPGGRSGSPHFKRKLQGPSPRHWVYSAASCGEQCFDSVANSTAGASFARTSCCAVLPVRRAFGGELFHLFKSDPVERAGGKGGFWAASRLFPAALTSGAWWQLQLAEAYSLPRRAQAIRRSFLSSFSVHSDGSATTASDRLWCQGLHPRGQERVCVHTAPMWALPLSCHIARCSHPAAAQGRVPPLLCSP